jgi:hypothetical protein
VPEQPLTLRTESALPPPPGPKRTITAGTLLDWLVTPLTLLIAGILLPVSRASAGSASRPAPGGSPRQ